MKVIQNEEAEVGVLGACLQSRHATGQNPVDIALDKGASEGWFSTPSNRHLWSVLVEMHTSGEAIDLLTVGAKLKKEGKLEPIGGYEKLEWLIDKTPTVAHIEWYADEANKTYKRRKAYEIACETMDTALVDDCDPDVMIADTLDMLMNLSEEREADVPIHELGEMFIEDCKAGKAGHLPHFCEEWDKEFGLLSNEIVFVHAPRSTGKTAFVIQWQRRLAKMGIRVPLLSLESLKKAIVPRYIAQEARINTLDLKRKNLPAGHPHYRLAAQANARLESMNLVVQDGKFPIENLMPYMISQKKLGAKAVIIDNLLCLSTTHKFDSRTLMYIYFLEKIRDVRNKVELPIIILAHPNDEGKIAWAKDVENLADIIVFLFDTEKMINAGKIPEWETVGINTAVPEGHVHISAKFQKNRDGETPRKDLDFFPEIQTFTAK